MEGEESQDGVRVTRARARRLSVTDSRPSTPLLKDDTSDRASPRPTRRTRLNSVSDLGTPGRTTRNSVARGETPEPPTTPLSMIKRNAKFDRTPLAKSARKQLPLTEEVEDESAITTTPPPRQGVTTRRSASQSPLLTAVIDEMRVTSATPPPTRTSPRLNKVVAPLAAKSTKDADKKVEEMDQKLNVTPTVKVATTRKLSVKLNNNSALKNKNMNTAGNTNNKEVEVIDAKEKLSQEIAKPAMKDTEDLETPKKITVASSQEKSDGIIPQDNHDTPIAIIPEKKQNSSKETIPEKTQDLQKEIMPERKQDSPKKVIPELTQNSKKEIVAEQAKDSPVAEDIPMDSCEETPAANELELQLKYGDREDEEQTKDVSVVKNSERNQDSPKKVIPELTQNSKKEMVAEQSKDSPVAEDILMDSCEETPAANELELQLKYGDREDEVRNSELDETQSIVHESMDVDDQKSVEEKADDDVKQPKKVVVFDNVSEVTEEKASFPKTPARVKQPSLLVVNVDKNDSKVEPLQMKVISSSTPVGKSEQAPAPAQIDAIKPFKDLDTDVTSDSPKPVKGNKLLNRMKSTKDYEDKEEEDDNDASEDDDVDMSALILHEAECVDDYQSGDSMTSMERLEQEENEIPYDGESVGSQDTSIDEEEEGDDDNDDDNSINSFVVSDEEEEEKEEEEDDNDEELEEGEMQNTSHTAKKYRRVIVDDSSSEEEKEQKVEESPQAEPIPNKNVSACSSNTSKLSETAKLLNASAEFEASEDEEQLEISRKIALKDLSKSDRFNKSVPLLVVTDDEEDEKEEKDEEKEEEEEYVEGEELERSKTSRRTRSVYEISDSSFEDQEAAAAPPTSPKEHNKSVNKGIQSQEQSKNDIQSDASKLRKDEEELLSAISGDLTHLKPLFNPLQKSRRRTLNANSPDDASSAKQQKLKRRSEQLLIPNDFEPSRSFIESLAKMQPEQQSKRKRLSKSLCETADLDSEKMLHEDKKSKKVEAELQVELELEDEVAPNHLPTGEQEKYEEGEENEKEQPAVANVEPEKGESKKLPPPKVKSADYYMDYCDALLQKANQAALEKKKLAIASGKTKKKVAPVKPQSTEVVPPGESNPVAIPPQPSREVQPKKQVKRLQATKKAIKHAINMLAPDTEPLSIARKLSPQPLGSIKPSHVKGHVEKRRQSSDKKPKTSPVKSSDEENGSRLINRIKTSAGYFTVSANSPKGKNKVIELVKTSTGIMRVEASTPEPKYFREEAPTPKERYGFHVEPSTPQTSKKRNAAGGGSKYSHATASALKFRQQMFARK